jgi:hypothetical protein
MLFDTALRFARITKVRKAPCIKAIDRSKSCKDYPNVRDVLELAGDRLSQVSWSGRAPAAREGRVCADLSKAL